MAILSLDLSRQLKAAGLQWQPALHDEFAIPDRGLDDRTFVVTDMLSTIQSVQGKQVVSFHGSLEWALDSLVTSEVIWVPSEGQLRELIVSFLRDLTAAVNSNGPPDPGSIVLRGVIDGYQCEITFAGKTELFEGTTAPEAYAQALLFLLRARL